MPTVFICYRREDSGQQAGRLFDHLVSHLGADQVFKDVDSIPLGHDFRKVLSTKVGQCDVLLALVGDQWLTITDAGGQRRLDDPADFVRIEIETALRRDIPVIPLLVGRAPVPGAEALPLTLKDLAYKHGMPLRPDPDFHHDIGRLVRGIAEVASSNRAPEPRQSAMSPRHEPTRAPKDQAAASPIVLGPLIERYGASWLYVHVFYFMAFLSSAFGVCSVVLALAPGTLPPITVKDGPDKGTSAIGVFVFCSGFGALLALFAAAHSQVSVSLYQGGFTYLQTSQSPERISSDGPEVSMVSQLVNHFVSSAIRPQEDRGAPVLEYSENARGRPTGEHPVRILGDLNPVLEKRWLQSSQGIVRNDRSASPADHGSVQCKRGKNPV